jgi:hypothetical protein
MMLSIDAGDRTSGVLFTPARFFDYPRQCRYRAVLEYFSRMQPEPGLVSFGGDLKDQQRIAA